MPLLDDFEDGDVAEWNGSAAGSEFVASMTNAISGTYSGEFSSSSGNSYEVDLDYGPNSDSVKFQFRIEQTSGDFSILIYDGGTQLVNIQILGGTIYLNQFSTGASITADQTYTMRLSMDYGADQIALLLDGSQIDSDSFVNSASSADSFRLGASDDMLARIDDIRTGTPPDGVTIATGTVNADSVELTASDVETENTYDVYRSESSGVGTGDTTVGDNVSFPFIDSGLENGERYYYAVEEANNFGTALSNEVGATTALPSPTSSGFVQNVFGADRLGYWTGDVNQLGSVDGYDDVGEITLTSNFDNIFTGQFRRIDVPAYAADGNDLLLEFYAKWDVIPTWETTFTYSEWVEKPSPDPNNYQRYVLRTDGRDSGSNDEYFRIYYLPDQDNGTTSRIADPQVYPASSWVGLAYDTPDNSSDGGVRWYLSEDGSQGTQQADVPVPEPPVVVVGNLEDGEQYYVTAERYTDHASASVQDSTITDLPAATNFSASNT